MDEFENTPINSEAASVESSKKSSEVPSDIAEKGSDAIHNYLEQQMKRDEAQEKTYVGKDFAQEEPGQENNTEPKEEKPEINSENIQNNEAKPESIKERTQKINEKIKQQDQEIASLKGNIKKLEQEIADLRKQINLPKPETEDPSIVALKKKLDQKEQTKNNLEEEKINLISPQSESIPETAAEKNERKSELQKALDELFIDFKNIQNNDPANWKHITTVGVKLDGSRIINKNFEEIDANTIIELTKLFIEGIKTLSTIEQKLPNIEAKLDQLLVQTKLSEKENQKTNSDNSTNENPNLGDTNTKNA